MGKAKESNLEISIPVYTRKWKWRAVAEVIKRIRQGEGQVLCKLCLWGKLQDAMQQERCKKGGCKRSDTNIAEKQQTTAKQRWLRLRLPLSLTEGSQAGHSPTTSWPDLVTRQPRFCQSGQKWEGLNGFLNFVPLQTFLNSALSPVRNAVTESLTHCLT